MHIFQSPAKDIKNVIVLTKSINKMFSVFMSGMFEGKIMTKRNVNIKAVSSGLDMRKLFKSKFTDMKGYTYRVAALPYAPFLMKNEKDIFSGYEILQLRALGSLLNFT